MKTAVRNTAAVIPVRAAASAGSAAETEVATVVDATAAAGATVGVPVRLSLFPDESCRLVFKQH